MDCEQAGRLMPIARLAAARVAWYDQGMKRAKKPVKGAGTVAKVTVSMPWDTLDRARRAVERGRAKTLSALMSEALDYYVDKGDLDRVLQELQKQNPPDEDAKAWADRILREAALQP
jgi:hypothetical protein